MAKHSVAWSVQHTEQWMHVPAYDTIWTHGSCTFKASGMQPGLGTSQRPEVTRAFPTRPNFSILATWCIGQEDMESFRSTPSLVHTHFHSEFMSAPVHRQN